MIYCPSCKKPSAQKSGNCPHCGFNLGGKDKKAQGASPRQAQSTTSTEAHQFGGADIELDDSGAGAPLELAGTDSIPPQISAPVDKAFEPQRAIRISDEDVHPTSHSNSSLQSADAAMTAQVSQIDEIAQFGRCDDGIVGVMKYGLRVYQRLPQLNRETETVRKDKLQSWEALEVAKARLGRLVSRSSPTDPHLQRQIKKAQKADGKLDDIQKQEDRIDRQYQARYDILNQREDAVRGEMMPVEEEAARRKSAYEQISKERSRLNAKIKRTEIELRNVRELIEKKQLAYADLKRPKEERARLLKEIAEVDHRQPPLLKRLSIEQQNFDETLAPFESISSGLAQITATLGEFNTRVAEIKTEKAAVEKEHQAALDEIHNKAQGESKHAQEAWAAVGETVYVNKMLGGEHLNDVAIAAQRFFQVQEKLNLYEQALTSYDSGAYDLAKKYWIGAAALAGILIIIIIVSVVT